MLYIFNQKNTYTDTHIDRHFFLKYCGDMRRKFTTFLLVLLHLSAITNSQKDQPAVVKKAWSGVLEAMDWVRLSMSLKGPIRNESSYSSLHLTALSDCARLYEDTEPRLSKLVRGKDYSIDDAVAWLSAAASSHRSCLDGLQEMGLASYHEGAYKKLTLLIEDALAFYGNKKSTKSRGKGTIMVNYLLFAILLFCYQLETLCTYISYSEHIHSFIF